MGPSLFHCHVAAADTEGVFVVGDVVETAALEYGGQRGALGEALDGGREVGVSLPVAGQEVAEEGDDTAGVEVVERADKGAVGCCHLEEQQASAGLEDAEHLTESLLEVHEVADTEGAGYSVEGGVGERQVLGVRQLKGHGARHCAEHTPPPCGHSL